MIKIRKPSRRSYKVCDQCHAVVITAGKPRRGDRICPHRFRPRETMTPTVYYENAAGEIWSGPDADTKCPLQGYQRKEVQPHEIRRFERLMSRKMHREAREQIERQREASEAAAAQRAAIRRELDAEILKESEQWTSEQREFLHYALKHRDEPQYSRNEMPDFYVSAYN